MMALFSIFVADSDSLSRIGLRAVLSEGGFSQSVVEVDSFHELSAASPAGNSDIAIVDIHLRGLDGASGIATLLDRYPDLKVCALFDAVTREIVSQYLDVGVMGYVDKSGTASEIIDAIAAISEGRPYLSKLCPTDDVSVQTAANTCTLTRQQRKVLTVMATGKSNKEIARELGICEGTVKVHVNAAYRALGVHNRVSAVTVLRQQGHSLAAA